MKTEFMTLKKHELILLARDYKLERSFTKRLWKFIKDQEVDIEMNPKNSKETELVIKVRLIDYNQ